MTQTLPDLSAFSLEELGRYTASLSDDDLTAIMAGPQRSVLLDEWFTRMAAQANPDKIKDQEAVIHFAITERPDGGTDTYEMVIRDGACDVFRQPSETPRVTVTMNGVNFLKLITGKSDGTWLFVRRKIKINGDMVFGGKVMSWFDIPNA
ncbi:MAG: SCP2 sterol-binding domain-containing protein [Frankia sp.]|nr:SCP2 sterol-binding domain-containing protein [Frankia sp.]